MKDEKTYLLYESIVRNMQEGIFTLDMTGHITSLNTAAQTILHLGEDAVGKSFAMVFMGNDAGAENDDFCQAVLDAVYSGTVSHNTVVGYTAGGVTRQLFMSTSYLKTEGERVGISAVINDITELEELRDAVRAMEKIRSLNVELEKRNRFIQKTFGRYLSDDIVSAILDTKDGLEIGGKKQTVTILFSDLRGFTALSERMEPRALIDMLNDYLERMISIIMAHKGTILEFIGDAIVVVFGAPLENETHPQDGVACAVAMQCAMAEVNAHNAQCGYPVLEMGIGIHTGEVILGNIGSEKKTKYDIIGRNVNLASRIETYTVGGQILISPTVREACGAALQTGIELPIVPKGVRETMTVYEVRAFDRTVMPDTTQHFRPLLPPFPVMCRLLDGKHTGADDITGQVTAVSEREFIFVSDTAVPDYATLTLRVGGEELYAKMLGYAEGGQRLHLTSGSTAVFERG